MQNFSKKDVPVLSRVSHVLSAVAKNEQGRKNIIFFEKNKMYKKKLQLTHPNGRQDVDVIDREFQDLDHPCTDCAKNWFHREP